MIPSYYLLLLHLALALPLPTIQGLVYTVINNALETRGGQLFQDFMGVDGANSSMQAATYFVWLSVFVQKEESDRKQVGEIRLFIQPTMEQYVLHKINQGVHEIHIDANYIQSYVPKNFDSLDILGHIRIRDNVKSAINWMITYGVANALQWTANNDIPTALRVGIAAFAVVKSYHIPYYWAHAGDGNKWDERLDVTAQFFYYINKRKHHFVANLNKKMRISYRDSYFEEAAGMTIDEFWKIYKSCYRHA